MERENEDLNQLSVQLNKSTSDQQQQSSVSDVATEDVAEEAGEESTSVRTAAVQTESGVEDVEYYHDDFDDEDETEIETEIHN